MNQDDAELEAQWMARRAMKTPPWVPSGWDAAASDLLFQGEEKFRPEAARIFGLSSTRAKSFWGKADDAHAKRPRKYAALDLQWFRRNTLMQLLSKGGRLNEMSVAQIANERKSIATAIRKLLHVIHGKTEIEKLKIGDLLRFSVDETGSQNDPKSFGQIDDLVKDPIAKVLAFYTFSPDLEGMLLGLERRLSNGMPLGIFDPIQHRNALAPQPGRKATTKTYFDPQRVLMENSLIEHFFACTGKTQSALVAIAIEMAFDLKSGDVSAADVANRRRARRM